MSPLRTACSLVFLVAAPALCSCWHAWSPMTAAPEQQLNDTPPPALARIVFLRAREAGARHIQQPNPTPVHLIDESGRLLGDLAPDTWVSAQFPPGPHEIFAWHDQSIGHNELSALQATLLGGRTYYVELARSPGDPSHAALADGHELRLSRAPAPLAPLPNLAAMAVDPGRAKQWEASETDAIRERISEGRGRIARGDCELLRANEGFVAEGENP